MFKKAILQPENMNQSSFKQLQKVVYFAGEWN